ncbi:MAG: hypothetical protein SNJ79_08565 [Sphingomonadaceae bacterium]
MFRALVGAGALALAVTPAQSMDLIINGGFETGDYSGWTALALPNSNGGILTRPNGANGAFPNQPTNPNPGGATGSR